MGLVLIVGALSNQVNPNYLWLKQVAFMMLAVTLLPAHSLLKVTGLIHETHVGIAVDGCAGWMTVVTFYAVVCLAVAAVLAWAHKPESDVR